MTKLDPNHKQLHRVRSKDLERYKSGAIPAVQAVCGKIWAPKFPVEKLREKERCPICFPTEENRFSIAA